MNCNDVAQLFSDYLAGELDEAMKAEMQAHFASCASCRQEAESLSVIWQKLGALPEEHPSEALRSRFYAALAAYQHSLDHARPVKPWHELLGQWLQGWWPRRPAFQFVVAMGCLGAGLFLGYRFNAGESSHREIAQLRDEIYGMRQLVTLSLLQQQSPSERLRGVSWSYQDGKPDAEVLSALLQTVNYDPNVNVRLAAVDALSLFSDQATVRQGLIQSLPRQNSPLIQIALVDLMVEKHEQQALSTLRQLVQDEMVNKAVRQRIEWSIQQLQ